MFLPYFNILEKQNFVNIVNEISSDEDFEKFKSLIQDLSRDDNLLWRGMGDADLKLYNSCQRYFERISYKHRHAQYIDLIRNLLDYVASWNNSTVNNYLESQDVFNDPVAIMTLMQHFGFPTPLLDFSKNPYVSLFFSSSSSQYDFSKDELKNYSSLYCLNIHNNKLKLFNESYKTHFGAYRDQFEQLVSTPLLRIADDQPQYKIGTSLNIINQAGSFIYSNSPTDPFEIMIGKNDKTAEGVFTFQCWHIHKRFNHQIRVMLERSPHNINQEYIFPDLYKMIEDFNHGRR
jgi:hypothetical protein